MSNAVHGDVDDLVARLDRFGGQAVKAVNDGMRELMVKVQREARLRAPIDQGNLDAAIKISNANRRQSWTVYVDESMPDDTGKYTVGDYAMWLHEGVLGVTYNLGPRSLAKATGGSPVGPKYLEGAFFSIVNASALNKLQVILDAELERRSAARYPGRTR